MRLEAKQRHGDFSAETARKINLIVAKIDVTESRLSGKFNRNADTVNKIVTIPSTLRK